MNKFRNGDRVSIEAVVSSDYTHEGKIKIRVEPYYDIFVATINLKMVQPVFAVGDMVQCPEKGTDAAEILAVSGDHLWVSFGNGNYATWWASLVERVEPEPVTEAEAA